MAEISDPLVRTVEAAVSARRERIEKELRQDGLPEWVGVYRSGDGLGVNVALWVAPEAGAVYTWHGCLGLYDANHGSIVGATEDGLQIDLALDPVHNLRMYEAGLSRPIIGDRWIHVPWGEEAFLVPSNRMVGFCNAVNSRDIFELGSFPQRSRVPWLWLTEIPPGLPRVPAAYRPFLQDEPVRGAVTAVFAPVPPDAAGGALQSHSIHATVNVGLRYGLLPGMILYGTGGLMKGQVVAVEETQSTVEFQNSGRHLQVGAELTTRQPNAGRTLPLSRER